LQVTRKFDLIQAGFLRGEHLNLYNGMISNRRIAINI